MITKRLTRAIITLVILSMLHFSDGVCMHAKALGRETEPAQEMKNTDILQLSIDAEKDTFSSKESVRLQFRLKNVSKEVLTVKQVAPWRDYTLDVTTESGEKVSLTEYGSRLESMRKGDEHSVKFIKLEPDKELVDSLDIRELYKMAPGGIYVIKARRNFYRSGGKQVVEVVSNTVKVKIVG